MRADRLVATLLLLQSRGRVTAEEVATELEVSVRTARRDLEALAIAGLPVYSQAGRNGGWSLLGGARTDLTGLTAAEARTLFLVAGPSSSATPAAKAALRKLVRALPETFRAEAEAAASAVVIDAARWGERAAPDPPFLEPLQRAVIDGVQVRLGYRDRTRAVTERVVHPLGLVSKGTAWYLLAGTEAGQRTFHVWRVQSVERTGDPVERPAGFDLATAWGEVVERHAEWRRDGKVDIVGLAAPQVLGPLRGHLGPRLTVGEARPDGRVEVTIVMGTHAEVSELAGYADLEVTGPPEACAELAAIGARLTARYAPRRVRR